MVRLFAECRKQKLFKNEKNNKYFTRKIIKISEKKTL